ncbi:nerve growth factor [Polypterus senegalus]
MRSLTLALVFLIIVQAVEQIKGDAKAGEEQHTLDNLDIPPIGMATMAQQNERTAFASQLHHSQHESHTQREKQPQSWSPDPLTNTVTTVDPRLFTKRRYRSPRVLFSSQPPEDDEAIDDVPGMPGSRVKRHATPALHRGEYSVCDSISTWVGDKTRATDIKGQEVSVLAEVNINNTIIKQYFFETTCKIKQGQQSGCRGIDSKHWNSRCNNTHTFVRALTVENKLVAWRFIRINTACVCVLSRKSWRHWPIH